MPVVNTPTVNVAVPVPTPVQAKPKQPKPVVAPPQPQAQQAPAPIVPPQPQMQALILPWSPSPKKMSRLPKKVIKFAANSSNLVNLFKAMRLNPYDETLHGAIADAIEEQDGNSPFPQLIRSHFDTLGGSSGKNLWYGETENAWDGTHPFTAQLGEHGPFHLYLGHEGTPENQGVNQRWVIHAVARVHRNPQRDDTGYSFEFPHEEAHLIPRMFSAAAKYISPQIKNWGLGITERQQEAEQFDDQMQQEERERP